MNFQEKLEKYAELLIQVGINLKKDMPLVIQGPVEAKDLVELCVKKAYTLGASEVHVIWSSSYAKKAKLEFASISSLENIPSFVIDELMYYQKKGAGFLSFTGSDPELLKDIDPVRLHTNIKSRSEALENFSIALMNDENPWTVAAFAEENWALKVFPENNKNEAVEKLWDAIFYTCRIDENAIKNWQYHISNISDKASQLNSLGLDKLFYKSENGTELEIKLPKNHFWSGGNSKLPNGSPFVANIPTEEVFTLPHKDGVNGIVYSSMPLNYGGNLIDDFWLKFENGRIIDFNAEKGLDVLKDLINTDEGSHYLGEVALVPYQSPISLLNLLFYNTLFDENASCHLAIGKAYPTSLKGGENLNKEQLKEKGVNDSLAHVDFMIGTKDLSILGSTLDGTTVEIFKNGNWSI